MTILKKLLIGLIALIAILAVVGFLLPRQAHLERSIVINAPQNTIFTVLSGYTHFNEWSPWAALDPDTVYTFDGPSHGLGAAMAWQSDDPNVGNGSQRITSMTVPSRIESALDFGAQGTADAFFDLKPADGGTEVTWGFDSDLGMNPVGRYFGLVLDRMLGPQYEAGLESLKSLAEGLPAVDFADLNAEKTEVEAMTIAYVSSSTTQTNEAIAQAMAESYGKVTAFLVENELTPIGPPIAINRVWENNVYEFDAALPLAAAPDEGSIGADSEVKIGTTWSGEALKTQHQGAYDGMLETYQKIEAYLKAYGYEPAGDPWDVWINDPATTPEADLVTEIYFPLS